MQLGRSITLHISLLVSLRLSLLLVLIAVFSSGLWRTSSLLAQEAPPSTVTIDEINVVASELWCPICSGVRLDQCELKACDQMREQIHILLIDGASTEQIKDLLFEQYGPLVLGEPPRSGLNQLAWIVPFAVLAAGALYVLQLGRNMRASALDTSGQPIYSPESTEWSHQDREICQASKEIDRKVTEQHANALDLELQAYE